MERRHSTVNLMALRTFCWITSAAFLLAVAPTALRADGFFLVSFGEDLGGSPEWSSWSDPETPVVVSEHGGATDHGPITLFTSYSDHHWLSTRRQTPSVGAEDLGRFSLTDGAVGDTGWDPDFDAIGWPVVALTRFQVSGLRPFEYVYEFQLVAYRSKSSLTEISPNIHSSGEFRPTAETEDFTITNIHSSYSGPRALLIRARPNTDIPPFGISRIRGPHRFNPQFHIYWHSVPGRRYGIEVWEEGAGWASDFRTYTASNWETHGFVNGAAKGSKLFRVEELP